MEVSSPEMPGVYYKCLECGTVCTLDDRDNHVCPETPAAEQDRWAKEYEVNQWQHHKDLWDSFCNPELDSKAVLQILDEIHRHEGMMVAQAITKIEKALPPGKMHALVLKEMSTYLTDIRKYRQRHYDEIDEMRRKGISYKERMLKFRPSLIEFTDSFEAKLLRDSRAFEIRPIRDWFGFADLEDAKRHGFAWIIRSKILWGGLYTAPKN